MLLRSVRQPLAPAGSDLPARIRVGNWGRNKSVKGDYVINELTAKMHPLVLSKLNYDTVVLDFNHNTVKGSAAYEAEKEPRKIACNGTIEIVPGDGAFFIPSASGPNWTPEGKESVLGNHYADISPTIITNAAGEVLAITSAGLCRQGATEDLHLELHAHSNDDLLTLLATAKQTTHNTAQPSAMDKYKTLLLSLLGLSDTADDTAIDTAAKALAGKIDAASTAATTATQTANAAKEEVKTMSADLKALRELVQVGERESLISAAIREGKLVTQSVAKLPLDNLKEVLAELPAGVVPMDRRTPEAMQTHSAGVTGTDTEADAMAAAAGITAEDRKKYGA